MFSIVKISLLVFECYFFKAFILVYECNNLFLLQWYLCYFNDFFSSLWLTHIFFLFSLPVFLLMFLPIFKSGTLRTQMEALRADGALQLWPVHLAGTFPSGNPGVGIFRAFLWGCSNSPAKISLSCLEGMLLAATWENCFFPRLLTHIQFCDLLLKLHSLTWT